MLTLPGVGTTFSASLLARFSYAMFPLALILAVQHVTGSYTVAGACVGVFAITSVLMPLKARAIDRHGQRLVLRLFTCAFFAAVAATAAAVQFDVKSSPAYLLLSTLAGIAAPPIGPCMRALWAELTPQTDLRQRAYGLDSAAEESLYILGPVVASSLVLLTSEALTLFVIAVLNAGGALMMSAARAATRRPAPSVTAPSSGKTRKAAGPFSVPGFRVVVLTLFLIGLSTGPVDIAVAARAQQAGNAAVAGWVLGALAVGSAVGGLLWGRWRHTALVSQQLAALVALTGLGLIAAGLATPLVLTAGALVLAGLAVSPAFVVAYVASDELVSDANRNEANTWVNTLNNGGVALGSAGAGALIDAGSTAMAFFAGAVVLLLTATGLLLVRRGLEPVEAPDPTAISVAD